MKINLHGKHSVDFPFTVVDDQDFVSLSEITWYAHFERGRVYATSKHVKMHSLILDVPMVDHKNGDTLDNRRCNLRSATSSQNNRRRKSKGSSSFKGVSWDAKNLKWRASICVGREINLGRFLSEEDAAQAYDQAALKHFGEYARCNFQ